MEHARRLVDRGSTINYMEYADMPVIYMYIIVINDINHSYILVKVGYSDNICGRI